jgi:anti-anti-sigma factor
MSAQGERATVNPRPFGVSEEEVDGVRLIAVAGELDLNTAPQLEQPLGETADDARLLIDLSRCEFIDSTGIGLIVRAWQRIGGGPDGEGTGRFALCGLNDQVRRLLEITGLQTSITTYRGRDEALAQLGVG